MAVFLARQKCHDSAIEILSRKGDCWDNAVAESFFKSLKIELIYGNKLITKEEMELGTIKKEGTLL